MEVYNTLGTVYIEFRETSQDGGRNSSLVQLRENVEQLHQVLYAIHEAMVRLSLEQDARITCIEARTGHVRTLGSLVDVRLEDIATGHRPWEV